ncbi:MFS transporter [Collinsella tanakaei]|nr:MFS transporter [Collinsella tanakaei]
MLEQEDGESGSGRLSARQLRIVATLGFCGLVSAADNWFVSPALPAIAQTLAVAPAAAAVVLTAYLVPYGALQPVCGALGDTVGRLRLLRIIVLGLCVGTLLCAAVPSLPALELARILTGCFAAGIISVSQAFVGDVVGQRNRAGAVGILMGITFTGQGLSAGLGGILTDAVGWRAAFVSFGLLAALA